MGVWVLARAGVCACEYARVRGKLVSARMFVCASVCVHAYVRGCARVCQRVNAHMYMSVVSYLPI